VREREGRSRPISRKKRNKKKEEGKWSMKKRGNR